MLVILIGRPLSGKTTLLKQLSANGIPTISVDDYVKEIYQFNQLGYNLIKEQLGAEFVDAETVKIAKLREFVLLNETNFETLNNLIHPLIKNFLAQQTNCVIELPILFNSPIKFPYHKIIYLTANQQILKKRSKNLSINQKLFYNKINSKWDNFTSYDAIDLTIDTSNNLSENDIYLVKKLFNK